MELIDGNKPIELTEQQISDFDISAENLIKAGFDVTIDDLIDLYHGENPMMPSPEWNYPAVKVGPMIYGGFPATVQIEAYITHRNSGKVGNG